MSDFVKTALITGASRGLGRALALELARQGWSVLANARSKDALEELKDEAEGPGEIETLAGDISLEDTRRRLAERAAIWPEVRVVINNASLLGPSPQPELLDYPPQVLRKVLEVNTLAPLFTLQELSAHLSSNPVIINVTSDAGQERYPGWGGYGSSKAALEHISGVLAGENPSWKVYAVDPGDMNTQMHQEAFPGEDISHLPPPQASVPAFVALLENLPESGRFQAHSLQSVNSE